MLALYARLKKQPISQVYSIWVIAILAASFAPPFIRLAQNNGIPSIPLVFMRLGLAALLLTPVVILRHKDEIQALERRAIFWTAFAGFWISLHFLLLFIAFENNTVLTVQVLINTSPLWAALIESLVFRDKLRREVWVGIFFTIGGGMIIALASAQHMPILSPDANPFLGIILALLAAMAGAIYMTTGRHIRPQISAVPYVWILYGSGAIIAGLAVLFLKTPIVGYPSDGYFWMVMLVLVPQLIGHSGFNYLVAHVSATLVTISTQTVTVISGILAIFLFNELPNALEIIGSTIILVGVSVSIISSQRR